MDRHWVLNASPLIARGKVGLLALLERLCTVVALPRAVAQEIRGGPLDDPARHWVEQEAAGWVCDTPDTDPVLAAWDLGAGGTAVLIWARAHPEFESIPDDRAARNCAAALGLHVRGTVGVVLLAKREGLLPRVAPVLENLQPAGFRLKPTLLAAALRLVDEAPS